ncbi:MAG: FHA domain-containing protein [Bacteroidaceae bacterium]|nr:FHA domain-containing protein [Bacteroidaceae bacterium]
MPLLREVTIGRDKNCDIYLDQRCKYASSMHATIYYDGQQLMFRDSSSNGTLINNVNVRHRAVPITRGDTIMIAGQYPINWNQIDAFFPSARPAVVMPQPTPAPPPPPEVKPDTESWSWGAFALYPIWGFFNGCWWAFLVSFVSFTILPSILFGIFGRRQAWANGTWTSAADFNATQEKWDAWGLVMFIIGLVLSFVWVILVLAAL